MIEDSNSQRKAVGNVCLTLHREKLGLRPRFLRRNLRRILDSHEKLLRGDFHEPLREEMVANEKRTWGWDFPTTDMLRDYMSGDKPILQLESIQLRHAASNARIQKRPRAKVNNTDGLGWLPDPEIDAIWPCTIGVAVWNVQTSKKQIHFESLPAQILQSQSDDQDQQFDIKLHKPFFIEIDKLFVVTESGQNGSRSWKRTATAAYVLEITIQCQDSDDSADFLSRLEGKDALAYENAPGSEGILKATWEGLPTCPPDGHLLTLKRPRGHKSLELDYKLEAAMGWITRRDYRLKTYNKVFQSNNAKTQSERQLLTPSASDDMEKATRSYSIMWNYRDTSSTRTLAVKSLTCPLCRDNRDYAYFERLMLHCKNHHSHFSFDAEYISDKRDSSTFHATVTMAVAPQTQEKQNDEDAKEMNWVAPSRPFNLRAHLRGEDDWTGQTRPKSRKGWSRQPKDRTLSSAAPAQPSRKRLAPDEVEDLPKHSPKRHCVPQVPGVSFYRTTSKQLIQPGDIIVESDDDVDESWLAQTQGRALEDLGITGAAKDFTRAFNYHLALEQSDSSLLVRDALVRFARSHKDKFRDVQWQRLFRAKLNQLRAVGIIGDDVVSYCVRLIQAAQDDVTPVLGAEAASPDTENDPPNGSGQRTHDGSQQGRHINGRPMKSRQDYSEAPNGARSTSPENDLEVQKERRKRANGKAPLRELNQPNGVTTPREAASREQDMAKPNGNTMTQTRNQTCTCGKPAKDTRGTIACADPRCVRKDYHLACVGLERRVPGWRCHECSL